MPKITPDEAMEVFARGFSFTRSFTFPHPAEKMPEGVWALRDAPRTRGDYRTEEYIGQNVTPETLDTIARQQTRGRFRICAIQDGGTSDASLRAGFKALGYRLMTTEALMVHGFEEIDAVPDPLLIVQITTEAEADVLRQAAGGTRHILPSHLHMTPAPVRVYAAMDEGTPVGWVSSVAAGSFTWCASMFVQPPYRRRGIAQALMTRMLQGDRAERARGSVLLASHAGSKLYPIVGYQQIGTLFVFTPPREKTPGK